jgi:hypothetical protein
VIQSPQAASLGCAECRQGVYGASWPPPQRIAVNGDGPEYLHLCSLCGTYWLFDNRAAVTIPDKMAREHFPAHFADWSAKAINGTLPEIVTGDEFQPADFHSFRDAPPEGVLEQALADAKEGRRSRDSVMPLVRSAVLQVPSSTEPAPDGSGMTPLALNRPPTVWVLVWTRRDLARRFAGDAPYCLAFRGLDLIARLPEGFGLHFNFGAQLECQFEMPKM